MDWADVKRVTQDGSYRIHVPWDQLERQLAEWSQRGYCGFEMEPDFQRGRVWTNAQRSAYIESKLRGGVPNDVIRWNCPGWMGDFRGPMQLVDGLQRLTATLEFLNDRVEVFGPPGSPGVRLSDFTDRDGRVRYWMSTTNLEFVVNSLPTRKQVLRWYLELNSGGTPHTAEEIERVRRLLREEG